MPSPRYAAANQDIRTLLASMGIDDYHATLMIAHMFIAPATTDLDMSPIIMYIAALQTELAKMGAPLRPTGDLDLPTAAALQTIVGPGWQSTPWFQIGQYVVHAADRGATLTPPTPMPAMGATIDLPSLPSMPGGLMGWAALGAGAYYLFFHKH